MKKLILMLCLFPLASQSLNAEIVGEISTSFKLLGPNHKILIEAFDDPKVDGVTCHLSRAKTGGIKGAIGLAEDRANASIACRQIAPIKFREKLKQGERVFTKKTSLVFKKMQVIRFYDAKRNTLIYLVYSDRLISGSPNNSISTVPVMKWN